MAAKPLSSEAIALTEKKMDMTLDDIIKLSKTNGSKSKKQRAPNKSQRFFKGTQEDKSLKIRQYMNSRSSLRQRALAQRRSNFQGNSLPIATQAAQKAAIAPFRNRAVSRNSVANWNKPRPAGPMRRLGNPLNGGNALKKQQQSHQIGDTMPKQKPKTLDSLFANMKERRMRATFTHTNNGGFGVGFRGHVGNQPRQPWLRSRFGNYRN